LNEEGFICDSEGNRLQPEIAIPVTATTINIDAGGTLTAVDQAGNVVANETLNITDFPNPAGLSSIGKNYFVPTEASGEATDGQPGSDGLGSLLQGFLENANVDVVEEMVNMIVGQRAYEANSKVIKASDEMLQIANNVKA
jgi:flagellar basal-body rod protein FlgG